MLCSRSQIGEQDSNPSCLILDASGLPSTLPLWMKVSLNVLSDMHAKMGYFQRNFSSE